MRFNNPSTNKIIGYLILFAAFIPFAIGYNLINSGNLLIIGVIALVISYLGNRQYPKIEVESEQVVMNMNRMRST